MEERSGGGSKGQMARRVEEDFIFQGQNTNATWGKFAVGTSMRQRKKYTIKKRGERLGERSIEGGGWERRRAGAGGEWEGRRRDIRRWGGRRDGGPKGSGKAKGKMNKSL